MLVDTGIVFIPIIAMVLGHILGSHKGGDDEGSAAIQSLAQPRRILSPCSALISRRSLFDVELTDMEYHKPALRC